MTEGPTLNSRLSDDILSSFGIWISKLSITLEINDEAPVRPGGLSSL